MGAGDENYHNFNYPKLLHLYWDGSPLSYLNYLTIISFNKHHKDWKIIVYIPTTRTLTMSWKTQEHKHPYNGPCYFHKLRNIQNVTIQKMCLSKIGFDNDAPEVIKSDYLRYYVLQKHGGLWSDFDIIYTASVEEKMNFNQDAVIFKCITYNNPENKENETGTFYYPVGLFLSKPNNKFFKFILEQCIEHYDGDYQSMGASMFRALFPTDNEIFKIDNSIKICNEEYYLPCAWNELGELFDTKKNTLPLNNVGIHWFNGAYQSKQYVIDLEKRLNNFEVGCYLDKVIDKYIEPSKSVRPDFDNI